jgi:hypothetical protein
MMDVPEDYVILMILLALVAVIPEIRPPVRQYRLKLMLKDLNVNLIKHLVMEPIEGFIADVLLIRNAVHLLQWDVLMILVVELEQK